MSWMAKLYDTYEAGLTLELQDKQRLMPINHTFQNAHINIVIDMEGNFKRAAVLEKEQIVLPATEQSAGRSSGEAPHPLADKIQYIAKDYPNFGGKKKSYFKGYEKQLKDWYEHPSFSHPKLRALYKYISKGKVVEDLVTSKVLQTDEKDNNKLRCHWPFEPSTENPVPAIFKVLPKSNGKIEPGDALVCWSVEEEGNPNSDTWKDVELQQSWIQYSTMAEGIKDLCYVTNEKHRLAVNHPAKLRHSGDKAKLISANDISGFTFKGRFTDTKKSISEVGSQSVSIGLEITQKAHNALRWLISRQGYSNDGQIYVAWAISGKKIPDPLIDSWSLLSDDIIWQPEKETKDEDHIDLSVDIGQHFAYQFNRYLSGYRAILSPNEQIVVMGLDSATIGRMSVTYYRELMASEFLDRVHAWHSQFAWLQRHAIGTSSSKGAKEAEKKMIVWPVSTPIPRLIAETAYGSILKTNHALKKNVIERIVPCIVDERPFPKDIMLAAVRRTSNRNIKRLSQQYSNVKSETAAWEKQLGVACALFKGFYARHPDQSKRREYDMALEEERKSRDYLYGRLLAIAEYIEEIALNIGGENRPTMAARMMQRFADYPFSTWRTIELGLQPYLQRLQGTRPGFLANRKKELDTILNAFDPDDFLSKKSLSGEFLLGYHCQRQHWRNNRSDNNTPNKENNNHESE
jgi:CRISPR-associated protein Csd1